MAPHVGDLHLEAVGNPDDFKALDFKVHPNGGLVVMVKNILAKPVRAKEGISQERLHGSFTHDSESAEATRSLPVLELQR